MTKVLYEATLKTNFHLKVQRARPTETHVFLFWSGNMLSRVFPYSYILSKEKKRTNSFINIEVFVYCGLGMR